MIKEEKKQSSLSQIANGEKLHRLFVEAAVDVLKSFGESNVSTKHSTGSGEFIIFGDIYAAIESNENLIGWVTISLKRDYATKLGVQLSGLSADDFSPSDIDSIPGEMLNQMLGMVRTKLWKSEIRFQIALPIINPGCKTPHPFPNQTCWRRSTVSCGNYSMMIQDSLSCDDFPVEDSLSPAGDASISH